MSQRPPTARQSSGQPAEQDAQWVRIPFSGDITRVNLSGLPVVYRVNVLECPEEYREQVLEALNQAGYGSTRVEEGEVATISIPEGALDRTQSQSQTDEEQQVSQVRRGGRAAQLKDVEELEVQAFNLMEHREQVLKKMTRRDEEAFAQMLATGLERRFDELRRAIVQGRNTLNTKFQEFVETVAQVKASQFFTEHLRALEQRLVNPDEEMGARLEEIVQRMRAFGTTHTRETVQQAILARVRLFHRSNVDATVSEQAMRAVLEAEATLESAVNAIKAASQSRAKISEVAQQQLQEIAALKFVRAIRFLDGGLVVDTVPAKLCYRYEVQNRGVRKVEQRMVEIGEFRIILKLFRGDAQIALENLRYGKRSSYQHPHVSGKPTAGQSICWGNIRGAALKLLKEWNFLMLVQLIWNFLNSYNYGDCFTRLNVLWKNWTGEELPSPEVGGA